MIGNPEEERETGLRNKMVMGHTEAMQALLAKRGIGKVISYAADMIVNLQISLAKAQLVKPTRLSKGKTHKVKSGSSSTRG